jgi:hypothetical protein
LPIWDNGGYLTTLIYSTAEEAEVDADAEVTTDAIEEDLNMNEDDQEEVPYMDSLNGMVKDVVEQK